MCDCCARCAFARLLRLLCVAHVVPFVIGELVVPVVSVELVLLVVHLGPIVIVVMGVLVVYVVMCIIMQHATSVATILATIVAARRAIFWP